MKNLLQLLDEEFYAQFKDRQPVVSTIGSILDKSWKKPEMRVVFEALNHLSVLIAINL